MLIELHASDDFGIILKFTNKHIIQKDPQIFFYSSFFAFLRNFAQVKYTFHVLTQRVYKNVVIVKKKFQISHKKR